MLLFEKYGQHQPLNREQSGFMFSIVWLRRAAWDY
jgi:hypothetical protein